MKQNAQKLFENRIVDEILTVQELASRLKITESGVYKLVYRKEIPYVKVGRLLRFNWSDVLASFGR